MNEKGMPMLPSRWLNCPRMGDMILDIFIPFKTPLDSKFDYFIDSDKQFSVDDAFKLAEPYKLGFIIDLTKSWRFYNKREVVEVDCKYLKIECKGREERPTTEQVSLFIRVVNQFLDCNEGNKKIGVHCTHGFNRTGFMIVAYLVEELNYGVDIAVQIFADARPPGIYKHDYLEELFTRYGCIEDCPPAPERPPWCEENYDATQKQSFNVKDNDGEHDGDDDDDDEDESISDNNNSARKRRHRSNSPGDVLIKFPKTSYPPAPHGTPELMQGVTKVETLDQDSTEAHEARELANRLCLLSGFIYNDGQMVSAAEMVNDEDGDEDGQTNKKTKVSKRSLLFRGSQPVSMTQRNVGALINFEYCVSYKADGTRYFLLIMGPNRVYLIDRGNFVYKPDCLHFPTVPWIRKHEQDPCSVLGSSKFLDDSEGHLTNTLADGEMILCHDQSKPPNITSQEMSGTPRFLIYDLITLNNIPTGRLPFFERYTAIDKQIIWPRNTGGHLGLVDFNIQSFSVRRKIFRPLQQTEEFLKPFFLQTLDHASDGLVFQPCGPDDCYILGTSPFILKWKPANLNTIDFRCKIEFERKVGEIPGYVGHLFLGGLNVPSAKLAHVSSKDKNLDGKIVECVCVPGVGWKVLRIRTDKTEPNYHKSGVAIIESIMYPVTTEQLIMYVRQRMNKSNNSAQQPKQSQQHPQNYQHHHHHQTQQQSSSSRETQSK